MAAAPHLRTGAAAPLLQRVARPDMERGAAGAVPLDGLERLRGGAGLAKKLGLKNVGMLMVLLSLLYMPRAMNTCMSRMDQRTGKITRLGCGSSLTTANIITLAGLGLVLVNSRQFDRHGRSKLKMRLNGSLTVALGMFLVVSHSEAAQHSFYSRVNANLGLMLEWWGFVSLFYNFTPRFVAQIPRELGKLYNKLAGKAGMPAAAPRAQVDEAMQQKELDRLNRWAQSQQ
eukprot:Tamp_28319.p1 GENE.Tamp_28319~~Tamp_28319.p1  ORF type:complete len:257 (-),score=57.93 Tamp_28319:48-737(-)